MYKFLCKLLNWEDEIMKEPKILSVFYLFKGELIVM